MEINIKSFRVNREILANNIKCLRKRLGVSQEDLANRLGLNRGNIASYEKGTAEPKICNLARISQLFGVSIGDLISRDMMCDNNYKSAYTNFLRLNSQEAEMINDFDTKLANFKEILSSISKCHAFNMTQNQNVSPQTKIIEGQFSQLQNLTEELIRTQGQLLNFIKCRVKE